MAQKLIAFVLFFIAGSQTLAAAMLCMMPCCATVQTPTRAAQHQTAPMHMPAHHHHMEEPSPQLSVVCIQSAECNIVLQSALPQIQSRFSLVLAPNVVVKLERHPLTFRSGFALSFSDAPQFSGTPPPLRI